MLEKSFKHVDFLFAVIVLVSLLGFYQTYFRFFPSFKGFDFVVHFHSVMMLLWLGLLFVQPLLVKVKKIKIHRVLGRLSYIIVPLLLLSIFKVAKMSYQLALPKLPKEQVIGNITIAIPALIGFGIIYLMAIFYRKNTPYHMRFMIGTALLVIGPSLARILIINFELPVYLAVTTVRYIVIAIAALLLVYDIIKNNPLMPFAFTLIILLSMLIIWHLRTTLVWQGIGEKFADLLF
jgi:hypothetical protein